MNKHTFLVITLSLTFLSACTPTTPTTAPTQTLTLPPTQTYTPLPSPTITLTPTPELVSLDTLPAGLYIVITVYEQDQQLILDLEGNLIGVFLDFYAEGASINPQNTIIAYFTNSARVSRKRPDLFETQYTLGLYDLTANEVIPVDMGERFFAWGPKTWSPDGTKVVFDVMNANVPGWGLETRLGYFDIETRGYTYIDLWDGEASDAVWSPDGKWIVFESDHFSDIGYGISELFILETSCLDNVDTCKEHVKVLFRDENIHYRYHFWLADSQHLLFICDDEEGFFEWCIGDITTGEITIMTNKPESIYPLYPDLSPDGEWIIYYNEFDYDLYIMPFNGTEARLFIDRHRFSYDYFFWLTIP